MNPGMTSIPMCPRCMVELRIADRHGVEIDYCPQCRGVWLDRGELDKILDRAADMLRPEAPAYAPPIPSHPGSVPGYRDYDDDDDYRKYGHKRKKKSWLSDILDFD